MPLTHRHVELSALLFMGAPCLPETTRPPGTLRPRADLTTRLGTQGLLKR